MEHPGRSGGREFQALAATTVSARSPIVERRVDGTIILMCLRTEDEVVKHRWRLVDGLGEVAWRHVVQAAVRHQSSHTVGT